MSPQVFGFAFNSAMLTPHVSTESLPDPGCSPLASLWWHCGSFCLVSSSYHRLSHSLAWSRNHSTQQPWLRWRKYSLAWHWLDSTCTWDVNKLKHQENKAPSLQHRSQKLTISTLDKTWCQNLLHLTFASALSLHDMGVYTEHQLAWQSDPQPFFRLSPRPVPSHLCSPSLSLSPHHPCHPPFTLTHSPALPSMIISW